MPALQVFSLCRWGGSVTRAWKAARGLARGVRPLVTRRRRPEQRRHTWASPRRHDALRWRLVGRANRCLSRLDRGGNARLRANNAAPAFRGAVSAAPRVRPRVQREPPRTLLRTAGTPLRRHGNAHGDRHAARTPRRMPRKPGRLVWTTARPGPRRTRSACSGCAPSSCRHHCSPDKAGCRGSASRRRPRRGKHLHSPRAQPRAGVARSRREPSDNVAKVLPGLGLHCGASSSEAVIDAERIRTTERKDKPSWN